MNTQFLFQDVSEAFVGYIAKDPLTLHKNDTVTIRIVDQTILGVRVVDKNIRVVFKYYDPQNQCVFCRVDVWSI